MLVRILSAYLARRGFQVTPAVPGFPIQKPIDAHGVEVLADPAFQASCQQAAPYTFLDTPRLANLWQLARLTDPAGALCEIGSYRGGGALHISNACPGRRMYICEAFAQSFSRVDPTLDSSFHADLFKDNTRAGVEALFQGRDYRILDGFFPASCRTQGEHLPPLSFVHLDVDVYEGTRDSLAYLHPRMLPRSMIVLDDYRRRADGVMKAVAEFTAQHRTWSAFPLFPGQGILLPSTWYGHPST